MLADEAWLVVRDQVRRRGVAQLDRARRVRNHLGRARCRWRSPARWRLCVRGRKPFRRPSLLGSTPVEHYANVAEAQNIDGNLILLLEGGGVQIYAADVIALRKPA
ncbi:MAG: hypothetical protein R3D85_09610 [Paracoccaceae bacterium]